MALTKKIYYKTDVKDVDFDKSQFRQFVFDCLNDQRGWKKFGYEFIETDFGNLSSNKSNNYVSITLATNDYIKSKCHFSGMSCYDPSDKSITINYTNWMTGGKSGMPIDRYRTYAINHEMGHHLGLDHPTKEQLYNLYNDVNCCDPDKHNLTSVMIQLTRGPAVWGHLTPNEYPIVQEFELGNYLDHFRPINNISNASVQGGYSASMDITIIIFVMIFVIIVIILVFIMLIGKIKMCNKQNLII